MTDLARQLDALSASKRALLSRRLAARRAPSSELPRLPREPGVNVFRASLAQERLWALEQLVPGSPLHNLTHVFRAVGHLDLAVLRLGLETIIARHESLRTTFVAADGVPLQVVSPTAAANLRIVDLRRRDRTDAESSEAARAEIVMESSRPFDLVVGPLFRVVVFVVSDVAQVVCVRLHHLIADAWSAAILVRELVEVYTAGLEGRPPRLSPVTYQYADYAHWQRARLQEASAEVSREYWREQLRAAPYPTLSGKRPRRPLSLGGAVQRRVMPVSLTEAARRLGCEVGATFFTVLLAMWQLLISRWAEESDVTILAPIGNRVRPGVADTIGFFVNVVPLRTRVESDLRFRDLVRRVREVVRAAHRHQETPFEMLVGEVSTVRTLDRPPISPFGFALERAANERISLPDAELHAVELDATATSTDLLLIVCERDGDVEARLEYDRERFSSATASGVLRELEDCLARAVRDPDQRVGDLAVSAWHEVNAAAPSSTAGTFWQRFAAQAERSPDAVAARCGAQMLTYRDLKQRADAVVRGLRVHGVEHQAIVAVWGERDVELLCALLGILRAGAVYLPLDPRLPVSRVAQILRQSRARIVLGDAEVPAALLAAQEETEPRVVVPLAEMMTSRARGSEGCAPMDTQPGDLAYVIYTSGSTGEPKGAMITHAGLLNHLDAKIALLELGTGDRVAQTASTGFDVSIWQFLAVLLVGGCVEIVPDPDARDPRRLAEAVAGAALTVIETVPALLRLLLETSDRVGSLGSLRWLIVTGDALPPDLCRSWLGRYPGIPIVNAYGPTECSDDVTHHVVRTPPDPATVRIPIGRPIANTAIYVLDDDLTEVASGGVGEICVSGPGVGRGYLYDPVRTAEVFVANPFDPRGTALYRTGDRGRWRSDGTLECLGRIDQQVKIRGMRVELGEIEAVLMRHPAVRDAVVVACTDRGPEPRLIAYVVSAETDPPSAGTIRSFLADRLPDAMVPSAFVVAAALPLGANGKVDRRALAELSVAEPEMCDVARRPVTAIERLLVDLWSEVLQVEVRSIDENFFSLGGDSLASIRVAARARRHGVALAPRQIFEHQTVASLASVATTVATFEADQGLVTGDVEVTPIQHMFFAADLPEPHHYNMACLVEANGGVAPSCMTLAVQRLLQHHDALRLRFRRENDEWRAWIAGLDGPIPFAVVDLASYADAKAGMAIEALASEIQASLSLDAGPIVRVALFDLGAHRPSRLLIVVHHLACDVVSWPILLEDLARLHDGLRAGEPVALPPKTASVQQWARHLNEHRAGCTDELDYWQRECAGEPSARLPRDLAGADATIATIEHVRSTLDAQSTEAIRRLVAECRVSVEVALLAALATALTDEAGGESLMVYVEHHGRDAVELDVSRTVGWGTVVFPLRVPVAVSRRMLETIALVDRHLREVPNGGIGYGLLRFGSHAPEIAEDLSALPSPEVSLNYLGCTDLSARAGWRLARESCGREVGLGGRRPTILDVTGYLSNGALHVDWAYGSTLHRPATIEHLADRCFDHLREWIAEGAA